jgi:ABC-type multidrug transport system ATPase subunit
MSSGDSLLLIEDLRRRFGTRDVVSRLNLSLAPGERAALWGPNGSGKTTVLRCVAGTLAPSGGRIRVGTFDAGTLDARVLIGASLSQERSFYLRLSGRANLVFFARLRLPSKREAERHVLALEEELELSEIAATRVDRCSTGMIQQLGLARALLGNPRLLVLDEPTRSLDAEARKRLWTALDGRPEVALLLATHLDDDVSRCGSRVDLPT